MTSLTPPSTPHCPECGAAHRLGAKSCWLCGAKFPVSGPDQGVPTSPFAASQASSTEATAATFSLSSLFLVMTLAAVAAGVFAAAPGLGVLFLLVATPALVRTMIATSRQKARGIPSAPGEKVVAFLGSIGVVLLLILSVGVALFTACWTACAGGAVLSSAGEGPMIAGGVAGAVVGLALSGWVLRRIWHRGKKA